MGLTYSASPLTPDIEFEITTELPEEIAAIEKFTGTLWYVDGTNGSDADTGDNPNHAFRTVGKGLSSMVAGDRVIVRAGTYDENGLDLSEDGAELIGEIGAVLANSSGTVLTMSGDYTFLKGFRNIQSGQVGVHVTGLRCEIEDVKVGPGSSVGFDIDGENVRLRRCHVGGHTVTAYDVGANGCSIRDSTAIGRVTATRGFYISAGNRCRIYDSHSIGNATSGFEVAAGSDYCLIAECDSGGGDGDRVDDGEFTAWPNFTDRLDSEHHEHVYPISDGQGTAGDPVTVDNTATDDTPDTRSDQDYWGDTIRIVPVSAIPSVWWSAGLYIFATTADDVQQWQVFFPCPSCASARNGGNAWDLGETALTVADPSIFAANDLVWIASTSDPDGEILQVTNVTGNVVTVASETRASGNTGVRYNHVGGETMYLIYRSTDLRFHGFSGSFSASGARDFKRYDWIDSKRLRANASAIMRMLNASDAGASSFDAQIIYKD